MPKVSSVNFCCWVSCLRFRISKNFFRELVGLSLKGQLFWSSWMIMMCSSFVERSWVSSFVGISFSLFYAQWVQRKEKKIYSERTKVSSLNFLFLRFIPAISVGSSSLYYHLSWKGMSYGSVQLSENIFRVLVDGH